MSLRRLLVLVAVVGAGLAVVFGAAARQNPAAPTPSPAWSNDQLTALPADDWIGSHGNIMNQRHSTLTEVNTDNVKQLKIAWRTKLVIPGVKATVGALGVFAESSPVAYQGTMYMPDSSNNVWAMDGATGERIWTYRPKFPKGFTPLFPSRGVTIGDGKVYLAGGDGSIAALDQSSGRLVWKKMVVDWKQGYYFTAPVTYYRNMIITGTSGGDSGAPAKVIALNAKTGTRVWTFNAIPVKKSDPGYDTWPLHRAWVGGGAIWNVATVDPELNQVYLLVGNPVPYEGITRGPGKELFTESVIALKATTGKLVWHFQETHHDIWDYDPTNSNILFDLTYKGQMRKGIVNAGKTGWLYILDRRNGKPILGIPERKVKQEPKSHTYATQPIPIGEPFATQCASPNWKKFKPPGGGAYSVGCLYNPYSDTQWGAFAPAALGGANWPPSSFDPTTGYMYICSKDTQSAWRAIPADKVKLKPLGNFSQIEGLSPAKGAKTPDKFSTGRIVAMDLRTNRIAWQVKWSDMCYSGMMTTDGGLAFVGKNDGHFVAYDSKTGKQLWQSPKLAAGVNAPPVTYMANGKQYITVFAGGNGIASLFGGVKPFYGNSLYSFALPGSAGG